MIRSHMLKTFRVWMQHPGRIAITGGLKASEADQLSRQASCTPSSLPTRGAATHLFNGCSSVKPQKVLPD